MWQDALERVDAFTKTHRGKRIYGWRKETIERSFAEAKENHGLRYARMLGIRNMRDVSQAEFERVLDLINHRPRKRLNRRTPFDVFFQTVALA